MSKFLSKIVTSAVIVSLTCITSSLSAHADPAGSVQPFDCNPSTADVVDEADRYVAFDPPAKSIRLVNKGGADCGLVISDFPEKNLLWDSDYLRNYDDPRDPNALKIVMKGTDVDSIKDVVVRFCFKPQLGLPDLISVDVPLKNFRFDTFHGFTEFYARRNVIFGNRPGVPDLRKLTIILTKPGAVTLGGIKWGTELFRTYGQPTTIVTSNAGCAAGRECRTPVALLIKSKRLRAPQPPTRPTR